MNTVEPTTSAAEPTETSAPEPIPTDPPAPANTTFDPTTPSGEVEQAALADLAAFVTCLEQLPNCDVEAALSNSLLDYRDGNAELINGWNEAGYEARDTDDYFYRVDEIEFSEDGTEAIATMCVWGGTQLFLPATESSPEEIIDGEYESSRDRVLVRRIGESWVVTASETIEESVGEEANLCV